MENLHVSQWRLNMAIIWDVIDGVSIIYPEIKRQLIRVFVFQNIFGLDVWVLVVIVVFYDRRTEIVDVFDRPQSLLVVEMLEL